MSAEPGLFDFAARRARNVSDWSAVEWDEVARFIGPNAHRYRHAWEKMREKVARKGSGVALSFCWPCLLFSFAWFFYRKQWAMGLAVLLLPIIYSLFFSESSGGGLIGVLVGISLFAKVSYVQDAVGKIARIHEAGGNEEAIESAGGVSMVGGIIGGLLLALGYAAGILALLDAVP